MVSLCYRYDMAMTLRLSDELDEKLTLHSAKTGISKQRLAVIAIEEHLARQAQETFATDVVNKVLRRDKELFDRLADA